MLNVTARENEKHIEVNLSGALTLREVAEAWQRLETLYHQPKVLILNLAEVTDLDINICLHKVHEDCFEKERRKGECPVCKFEINCYIPEKPLAD